MDAMLGAIKARKSKDAPMGPDAPPPRGAAQPEGQGNVLHAIVMQLSPDQKDELMELLQQSQNVDAKSIEKGEPSPTEMAEVAAQSEADAQGDQESSDDIQASMVDRQAERMAEGNAKPRNLGERARMYAAKKLKSKGK